MAAAGKLTFQTGWSLPCPSFVMHSHLISHLSKMQANQMLLANHLRTQHQKQSLLALADGMLQRNSQSQPMDPSICGRIESEGNRLLPDFAAETLMVWASYLAFLFDIPEFSLVAELTLLSLRETNPGKDVC